MSDDILTAVKKASIRFGARAKCDDAECPIIIWNTSICIDLVLIGSFTSVVLRAGQTPFVDFDEAIRWMLFRPIVGVSPGKMK